MILRDDKHFRTGEDGDYIEEKERVELRVTSQEYTSAIVRQHNYLESSNGT